MTDSSPHSTLLSAEQAQAGLEAAAVEMRLQGLPRSADLIADCTRCLVEQLEVAERELAWFRKTRVTERAERDGLLEQLQAAQAEAELKRIETHHANAKRQSIEEQLEAATRKLAEGWDEVVAKDKARAIRAELRAERLVEQLEALRLALDEISRMGDSIGMAMHAREALAATSSPASEPRCDYCGALDWTIKRHGAVLHKCACPHRTEKRCQAHPDYCSVTYPATSDPFTGEPGPEDVSMYVEPDPASSPKEGK